MRTRMRLRGRGAKMEAGGDERGVGWRRGGIEGGGWKWWRKRRWKERHDADGGGGNAGGGGAGVAKGV